MNKIQIALIISLLGIIVTIGYMLSSDDLIDIYQTSNNEIKQKNITEKVREKETLQNKQTKHIDEKENNATSKHLYVRSHQEIENILKRRKEGREMFEHMKQKRIKHMREQELQKHRNTYKGENDV